jgi:hypothetical protein
MRFNYLLPVFVATITVSPTFLGGVLPATAVTLDYTLNGTFNDGAALSGTFSLDPATRGADYRITTTSGVLPGFTYQSGVPGNFYAPLQDAFQVTIANPSVPSQRPFTFLQLWFNTDNIFVAPPSGFLNLNGRNVSKEIFETQGVERFVTSGTATLQSNSQPIPEPISIIGTLIGGTAVWLKRKKLTAEAVKQ